MLQKILYILWFMLPLFFFGLALWSKLEKVGGKKQQDHPSDFIRQGVFVLFCVLIAVGIGQCFLKSFVDFLAIPGLPFGFLQWMLLRLVLWLLAQLIGPTKDIQISKSPNPSRGKRR